MFRFTDWYPHLKKYTPDSSIVTVPVEIAKKLELVLSNPATPLAHEGPVDEVMDVAIKYLELGELISKVNSEIKRYGGTAFVRWNNAYPKDVCPYIDDSRVIKIPGTMDNVCLFRDAKVFLYMSLNSMRIVSITAKEPGSLTPIIVRKPVKITNEVRVFIERGFPVAVIQYYYKEKYSVKNMKDYMLAAMYFALQLFMEIPHHSATFDVGVDADKRTFVLVEVNPPVSSEHTDKIYDALNYARQLERKSVLLAWMENDKWVTEEIPYKMLGEL